MIFRKLDWASSDWRVVYRAEGNCDCVYDITKQFGLWYVTSYQHGGNAEDSGSFNTMKEARAWAERQNQYLDFGGE